MNPLYQQQVIPQRNEPVQPSPSNVFEMIMSGQASPKTIAMTCLRNMDNSARARFRNAISSGMFKMFATKMGVSEANYNSFVNDINSMI